MWSGVFPAVTTKFTEDDRLDHAEMERCFALQIEAGCDGIIVCGSLGEGPMLSPRREARGAEDRAEASPAGKPVLLTVNEAGTREGAALARTRRQGRRRRPDGRAEPDLPHQSGRDGGDAEGGGGGRRPAGDDLFQPHRLPRRRDRRDHGGAGRRSAVRGDQGILRRHPPLDRDHQPLRRPLRPLHRRRQSRLRGAVGRRDRLGGRPGHRLPARDGGDLPADEAGPPRRGAGDLSLVPAAARSRRLDLSRPEHQARRSASRSAPTTACACRASRCRASGARRSRRSSRTRWRRGRSCRSSEVANQA